MKLPKERVPLYRPEVRNLTGHKVSDLRVTSSTHISNNVGSSGRPNCKVSFGLYKRSTKEHEVDIVLLPGKYSKRIERDGLDECLTSDDECLRAVAVLMKTFMDANKLGSSKVYPYKGLKKAARPVPPDDDFDFDFDEDEEEEDFE